MLLVFGSLNVDFVARVARIPGPGETVLAPTYERHFGGKGANQAVAAARALGRPGAVVMAGAVGGDPLGEATSADLAGEGIDVSAIRRVAEPTGIAFITVDDTGENAITVASGANAAAIPDGLESALADARVLVLQMECPLPATRDAARLARAAGVTVVLNLAPVPAEPDRDALWELLHASDVLVLNDHEARALAALLDLGAPSPVDLAARLTCDVIVTRGADGVVAARPDGATLAAPALPVTPVDTTGAGDAFVGALAACLAEGMPLDDAIRRGAVAGSLACVALGARAAVPTRAAIEAALTRGAVP